MSLPALASAPVRILGSRLLVLTTVLSLFSFSLQGQVTVVDPPGQGFFLPSGPIGLELSGIVHVAGNDWLAISDATGDAYQLTVALGSDGTIASATVGSGLGLSGVSDGEGIALGPGSLFVVDESGPGIDRFDPVDGSYLGSLTVPLVFFDARPNLGLESLARSDVGALWTGNEEALVVDGAPSTFSAGTTVRLQRFEDTGQPDGQWAYVTDPLTGDLAFSSSGDDGEASGLVDLVALDDGRLLALERAGGGDPTSSGAPIARNRLYLIELGCATDTSALGELDGAAYAAVGKTLLWEKVFPVDPFDQVNHPALNFEGIGLGGELADGSRTLLLISDDGSAASSPVDPKQALYALKLVLDPNHLFTDDFERGCLGRWSSATP